MAKRLATDYVHAHLRLTETSLNELLLRMDECSYEMNVMVFDNGNQEIVLTEKGAEEERIVLPIEKQQHEFVLSDVSLHLKSFSLSEVFRQAIIEHQGDATMHRIYESTTIVYEYRGGKVMRITEQLEGSQIRLIYENKCWSNELQQMLAKQDVEREIQQVREQIDDLLDERMVAEKRQQQAIDEQLRHQSKKLFMLEP